MNGRYAPARRQGEYAPLPCYVLAQEFGRCSVLAGALFEPLQPVPQRCHPTCPGFGGQGTVGDFDRESRALSTRRLLRVRGVEKHATFALADQSDACDQNRTQAVRHQADPSRVPADHITPVKRVGALTAVFRTKKESST